MTKRNYKSKIKRYEKVQHMSNGHSRRTEQKGQEVIFKEVMIMMKNLPELMKDSNLQIKKQDSIQQDK